TRRSITGAENACSVVPRLSERRLVMGRRIVVLLVAMLAAAAAFSACAAPLFFHLEGGICTDGSTTTGLPGGPLLCGHHIKVEIEMVDGYVPGTPFSASPCCDTSPVVRFLF